jgi:hypothetical protein
MTFGELSIVRKPYFLSLIFDGFVSLFNFEHWGGAI